MKYSVITFGCRVNQADSLGFEEALLSAKASSASPEEADLVIVNTCSVTASADQGARQTIRRISRTNPTARIVVTGCYATRCPDEISELPVVDVIGNDDKPRLTSLLKGIQLRPVWGRLGRVDSLEGSDDLHPGHELTTTAERFGNGEGSCGATIEPGVAGRTAFTLRVQTGCAEPCAYCIIPTTRGCPRSLPIDEVLREVDRICRAGFKEIALTGVHLGSYGRDLSPRSSLGELLCALAEGSVRLQPDQGDRLFRISSLEPMDCTPDVVSLVAENDCFAPHFHLPMQHASNRILRAMRRPYSVEQFTSLVEEIRSRIAHAAIGSDVIVGFPGESEQDFEQLAAYLEQSPLTHVHVFPYSDRPGTAAAGMAGKVPGSAIRDRARRIREISDVLARRFRAEQVGRIHRGLTLEDGALVVTGNYLKVRIPPGHRRNEWVDVRVGRDGPPMTGEVC